MFWSVPRMDSYEGELLRRSVLIRNAIKTAAISLPTSRKVSISAATSIAPISLSSPQPSSSSPSPSTSALSDDKISALKSERERWMLMVNRAGMHPFDQLVLDENESANEDCESGYRYGQHSQQVQTSDYYSDDDEDDEDGSEDENEWFRGLLQEVSTNQRSHDTSSSSSMNASTLGDEDNDGAANASSTPSLPSLIVDLEDDSSEEEDDEEALQAQGGDISNNVARHSRSSLASIDKHTAHLYPRPISQFSHSH
ncbi:hypothetical protein CBS101457_005870 [Exobasidium rhododendri]|nr:hypothetical protein CBS101457_005870 [Exobasidium rhododendri]